MSVALLKKVRERDGRVSSFFLTSPYCWILMKAASVVHSSRIDSKG